MGSVKKLNALLVFLIAFCDLLLSFALVTRGFQYFKDMYLRNFDIRDSMVDILFCGLLRFSAVVGGLVGVLRAKEPGAQRISAYFLAPICLSLFFMSYTPFKACALAELDGSISQVSVWVWVALGWNILGAVCFLLNWRFLSRSVVIPSQGDNKEGSAEGGQTSEGVEVVSGNFESDRDLLVNNNHGREITASTSSTKKEEQHEELKKPSLGFMKRLLGYCSQEWRLYICGFFFLFIYSGARIFIPYYTAQVIGNIVINHSYADLVHSVEIMLILSVTSAFFGGLRGGSFMYAIAKVSRHIRGDLFASLTSQEIGFYDKTKTGEITSRLTADCQTMGDTVGLNTNVFLRNLIMFVGSMVVMFKISWQLTMITFIAMPLIALISKVYGSYYDRLSQETQDELAKANEVADEVLSSMRTVRSFACEGEESGRYWGKLDKVLAVKLRQVFAYVGYVWSNELFDLLLLTAVLWYGGHLVIAGRISKQDLISFLLYQLQLGETLLGMGAVYTGLMQSVGASRKVFEYIDRQPEMTYDGDKRAEKLEGRVEFRNVSFTYPSRPHVTVLKDISFTVEPGETVALVGPSGGGKSSCFSLLQHFYRPSQGVVLVDGVPVHNYDHTFFHQKLSVVSQEPVLFAKSIAENIRYGLESEADDNTVIESGKMANAHDFIDELPDKYNTEVGEKGVQLSGGQKQRVAIARSLIRSPNILLLDEATSALDAESEHLVQQAIYNNLEGRTVLLIAHRLSTVEKADRIVVVDKGRVVQQGPHAQLLKTDGLYRNLVQRQLLGFDNYTENSKVNVAGSSRQNIPDRDDMVTPSESSYKSKSPSPLSSSPPTPIPTP